MLQDILFELKGIEAKKQALANGDYLKDDLLYCGKCNTPKEAYVTFFGKVPCMCKCTIEKNEEEEKRFKDEEKRIEIERRKFACFDSKEFWSYTFEKCTIKDDPIYLTAKSYANNFVTELKEGTGLTFFGNTGNGKTYLAAAIANDLLEKGYTCRMASFETIESEIRENGDKLTSYYKDLLSNDLLIIDDLGAERDTSYMKSIVTNVIDKRSKPLIITTNLTSKELQSVEDRTNTRIYSRIMGKTIPVKFSGEDMRRDILKEKYMRYKDVLCLTREDEK